MLTVGRTERFAAVAWIERRPRWQRRLVVALVAAYLLWRLLQLAAVILLDRWWFDTLTDAPVWSTITTAKVQLALGGGVVTALVLGFTVFAVLRSGPVTGSVGAALVRRYQRRMGPAHRWILIALVVIVTARVTIAAMDSWQPWLLFRNTPDVGVSVPELGGDLGDHLFRLPFLSIVSDWLRSLLIVAFVVAAIGHALSGALRVPISGHRSARGALAHLATLGAAYFALVALDAVYVARPSLATRGGSSFVGAGYTEVNVIAPALYLVAALSVIVAFTLVNGARTGRWKLPAAALTGWVILELLLLVVAAPLIERFVVKPAEGDRQIPYVAHNLDATTTAYHLDDVEMSAQQLDDGLSASTDLDSVEGVPLFTRDQLVSPLQVLQGTTATRISDVDLDRYEIDGVRRPVMLGVRNASRPDLPERGWVQEHLVYTHGDGVVTVPADTTAPDGRPDVNALEGELVPDRSQIYFGEGLRGWYAIVDTKRPEYDGTSFDAGTGISMGSTLRRATLAVATGESQPLLSSELTSDSQLLYRRDVRERLNALAPFLSFDSDPYPVVTDGGVTWVVDGYTTSSSYPYAQRAPTAQLAAGSGIGGRPNYVNGAVKATVDAYDGSVHLYRTAAGEDDVILGVWEDVFPGLVESMDAMPDDLRTHLRYPTDLMTIQTQMLGRYHVDNAELLFSGADEWSVAGAASSGVGAQGSGLAPPVWLFQPAGDTAAGDWVAVTVYNPGDSSMPSSVRNELSALAVGNHDRPDQLQLIRTDATDDPNAPQVATPLVSQSAIDADPELARVFTLLNANGSRVQFGPMTPLLVGDDLAYVRSIVVTGTADTTAPRLYGVLAVSNGFVALGDTVDEALQKATTASE